METHDSDKAKKTGSIQFPVPWWELKHRDLPYIHEPFNNQADVDKWRELGYTQTRFTGDMYDMRQPEPDWIAPFRELLPMKHFSWSLYRMRPGDVLPNHCDTYLKFREIYNVVDPETIRRYVIFLEDWQSGHYLEMNCQVIPPWRAGQGVFWHNDVLHLAANVGKTPRYTLQLTGVME